MSSDAKNISESQSESGEKTERQKNHDAIRIVIGIILSIIVWIGLWQLSEIHINTRSKNTQTAIYLSVLVVTFLLLFWLAKKYPSCIGMGQ